MAAYSKFDLRAIPCSIREKQNFPGARGQQEGQVREEEMVISGKNQPTATSNTPKPGTSQPSLSKDLTI